MKFTTLRSLVLTALVTCATISPIHAQDQLPSEQENHPTIKVVREYLKCMLEQDWNASSQLVETRSLEDLRNDYVKRVKSSATLDEEKMVLSKFGVSSLEDIEKLSGVNFYITYHKLLKERAPTDPEILKKVKESMKMRILSLALENDKLAHVLVRTKHNNSKVNIESLEVISLVKVGDKWMVGLNEQAPKVTPLDKAAAGGTAPAPAATPEPAAPAKPETKPAPTKPATKGKGK